MQVFGVEDLSNMNFWLGFPNSEQKSQVLELVHFLQFWRQGLNSEASG